MAMYGCGGHGCVLGRGRMRCHVIWILGVYASLWHVCLNRSIIRGRLGQLESSLLLTVP